MARSPGEGERFDGMVGIHIYIYNMYILIICIYIYVYTYIDNYIYMYTWDGIIAEIFIDVCVQIMVTFCVARNSFFVKQR